jgi:hypothetical protein
MFSFGATMCMFCDIDHETRVHQHMNKALFEPFPAKERIVDWHECKQDLDSQAGLKNTITNSMSIMHAIIV